MKHIIHAPHLSSLSEEQKQQIYARAREEAGIAEYTGPITVKVIPLWEELHRRALVVEYDDTEFLLGNFARRVPCGECRRHWLEMFKRTPIESHRYFDWTVDRHNEVNARLGKPVISYEEARRIWG